MSVKYGFKVCRVCLTPEPAVKLKSMLDGRGKMADWFQLVSGCSISYDRGKHEAMICPKCSNDVKAAFDLRENIRRVDVYYFQARREEAVEEDFVREQAAVKNTPAKDDSQGEVSTEPSGSGGIPGQVQLSVTKLKSFAAAAKPLKCHVCEKTFGQKSALRRHIETIHEKIKNFTCDFCPTKCNRKSNLSVHIIRKHMSAESCPRLKCDFKGCKKVFRTDDLFQHKKSHSNERPYSCSTCQESFKRSQELKSHQKVHISERPFSCLGCLMTFKRSNNQKEHHQKNRCTSKA